MTGAVEFLSADMAVAASNAHAFLPAASLKLQDARLVISGSTVTITASDTYAGGEAVFSLKDSEGELVCGVDRKSLEALDKAGRADKKNVGRFTWTDECVTYHPNDEEVEKVVFERLPLNEPAWEAYDAILARELEKEPGLPEVLCLDPALLMRFSKVKADKAERKMDLYVTDAWAPVVVRIGPAFTGFIMPIQRDIHAENIGSDGLWT